VEGCKLNAANLGDSGFIIIRDSKIVLESKPQQIQFSMPYQLGSSSRMAPKTHAQVYRFILNSQDVIVMGSDGLFDNLGIEFITQKVAHFLKNEPDRPTIPKNELEFFPARIQDMLNTTTSFTQFLSVYFAQLAFYRSNDKETDTPYSIASRKDGYDHSGGKPDDITVVVAKLVIETPKIETPKQT